MRLQIVSLILLAVCITRCVAFLPFGNIYNGSTRINAHGSEIGSEIIQSPALKQVWPALQSHIEEYGHPNIPLGTLQGRQCQALRRLHLQQKLTDQEVQLLESIGFYFHSLEDVYNNVDFDEFMQKLKDYAKSNNGDVSPPKKYQPDPELGAWVTGLRRLGPDRVDPDHVQRLNEIGFAWTSSRPCGSAFMKTYREISNRLENESMETIRQEKDVQIWLTAQQKVHARGEMTEARQHYMDQLFGSDWTSS